MKPSRPIRRFLPGLAAIYLLVSFAVGARIESGGAAFVDPVFASRLAPLQSRWTAEPGARRVLCLGSSRAMSGIDADALAESGTDSVAFNFGVPAGGPVTTNLYLRRLLERGVRPDRLVLEVLPPFLAGQNGVVGERAWLTPDRLHPREAEWFCTTGIPFAVPSRFDQWLRPLSVWRNGLQTRAIPNWVASGANLASTEDMLPSGFVPWPNDPTTDERRRGAVETTRGQYRAILDGFEVGAPMLGCLRDTLEICRRDGIRVDLLLMPESSEFRSWYPAGADSAILKGVRGLNSRVIDHRRAMPDGEFADGHHLHRDGARRYTRLLAAALADGDRD